MKNIRNLIFTLCLLAPLFSRALSLSEETDYGSAEFYQLVSADGDFISSNPDDDDSPFSWNLAYSYQRMVTPNDGSPNIIDNTNTYTAGLLWSGDSEFSLGAKLNYSDTPNESLVVRGGQLSGAYRWVYSGPDEDKFSPYTNFKLIGSNSDYLETFDGEVARKKGATKPTTGTSELRQSMLGVDVTWKPVKTWRFDFEVDGYSYNRNVAAFESQLDSPTAIQRGMNGFTGTVGGVANVTYSANVSWDFATDWRAYISEQYSRLAADNSISTTFRATLSDQLTKRWKVTAGVQRDTSDVLTDTLAILGVDCEI